MKDLKARLSEYIKNSSNDALAVLWLKQDIDKAFAWLSAVKNLDTSEFKELTSFSCALSDIITEHVTEIERENYDLQTESAYIMNSGQNTIRATA